LGVATVGQSFTCISSDTHDPLTSMEDQGH
jgi:hypothetical protein